MEGGKGKPRSEGRSEPLERAPEPKHLSPWEERELWERAQLEELDQIREGERSAWWKQSKPY